jgi:hypothetical protein
MWWRLSVLGAVTAALLFLVLAPIATMSVTVDMPPLPPGARAIPSAGEVKAVAAAAGWIAEAALVTAILGVAGWLAWRIVRHHRISS